MSDIKQIIGEVFPEGSDEFETLVECYNLVMGSAPSIAAEAKTNMILLDHMRMKLSTLYFLLERSISSKRSQYQSDYDAAYTRLVKLGRPSNTAIEAEIRATVPNYLVGSGEVEKLEQVKSLILGYLRGIDAYKQTSVELLRDSRRLD